MAINHVLTSPIADFTGTVTVFNSAGQTTTANATQIVRPSDWNSAHVLASTISGNTAGVSTLSGTNIVLAGGNNVTLSANGSTVSVIAPTQTAFVLSNSNGISFGTNGSTVTASHNGLTTARASNDGVGLNTAQTNVTWTVNSAGISVNASGYAGTNTGFTGGASISGSMTLNSQGLSVSLSHPAWLTTAAQSNHSHGNPTLALTNLSGTTASASNGLTLSLSANAPGAATLTAYAVSNTTQSTSGTIPGSVVSFQGNGGVSVGVSNGSVVVSGPALTSLSVTGALSASSNGSTISLGVGTVTASAIGNTTQTSSGTINLAGPVFSGAGGVSVGYSNGTVILSGATGGGGGGAESNAINLLGANTSGNTTATGSTIGWSGVNITLSGTNGSQVVVSAPATSSLSATGAVSLSTNGSTISIGVGTVTANAASNTTQNSTGTVNLNAMTFHGAGIASVGLSNGSVVISVPSGGGAGDGVNILAAGTQTAATTGTVLFNNSNGITFGMSNSSVITASHNGITQQSTQPVAVSGQNGSYAFSTLSFSNANGISFGTSAGSAVTASHNALTSQSNQAFSAGGGSSAFQTLSFSNANGATFTNTAGQVGLSYSVPVVSNAIQPVGSATGSGTNVSRFAADDHVHEGVFSIGVSTGGNTAGDTRVGAGRFVLAGGANITLSQATAAGGLNTISIVAGAGGGGGAGLSAGTQSVSTGTVVFSDSNGITFGMSGSSRITASYNSTQFAGTGTTFAGANISASMTLNSNGLNLSASVAAPGAAAENNAIALLGANTSGNTTATGSTIGWSGVNLTLSGTNASQVVISAPGTSSLVAPFPNAISTNGSTISIGHATYSGYNPYHDLPLVIGQPGQGTLQFEPEEFPNFQFDRLVFGVNNSNATNSSGSHTLSFWVGFYTRNASTLSLLTSTSSSTGITHSGTVGSYSLYSGLRVFTIPMTSTFTAGEYVIGFLSRTTSGGANGSYSNLIGSNLNSNFLGHFGSSHATTAQLTLGQGVYSATTSAMPGSVAFSQIRGSDSQALRAVYIHMMSGTV